MEHARAVRAVQERARKEREERRAKEALAEAALQWERDREARERREEEERLQAWAEAAKAVEDCSDDRAVQSLGAVRRAVELLPGPVGPGGATLLHRAVSRGLRGVIEAVLKLDASAVAHRDADGQTALHRAAAVDSSGALVALLAAHASAAELERRDGHGRTPLQLAREWALPEAAAAIVRAKAAAAAPAEAAAEAKARRGARAAGGPKFPGVGHMAAHDAIRERRFEDALGLIRETTWVFVNVKDAGKRSLLHSAAAWGRADLCEALLEREDFDTAEDVDKDVATALHLAAAGEKADCCRAIVSAGGGRFAAVNALDLRRRTALHLAAMRGDEASYRAIEGHPDCDPCLPDFDGKTAPEYASERGIEVDLPRTATDAVDL